MRYFKNENDIVFVDPIDQTGMTEIDEPVMEDGSPYPEHKNTNLLKTDPNDNLYSFYLLYPDGEGVYQPDYSKCLESEQQKCKYAMRMQTDYFVNSGAMVTVTVDLVDYTGCFHPTDSGLDSGAGASAYRESVDSTVPPVDFGSVWSCKDASGCYISIPMTETLLAKIGSYVKNWHVSCNRVYIERRDLMLAMTAEQLEAFDPEQDMIDNLPSRSIVIP